MITILSKKKRTVQAVTYEIVTEDEQHLWYVEHLVDYKGDVYNAVLLNKHNNDLTDTPIFKEIDEYIKTTKL